MHIEHLIAETLHGDPGRIALDDDNRQLTYRELATCVAQEAEFLRAMGGLRFATLADNGCGWVVADLAIHHLDRPHVPLPQYFTAGQQRHVLDSAAVDTVLTDDPAFAERGLGQFSPQGRSPHSGLAIFRRVVAEDQCRALSAGVTKITYTSGSTAEPRGVCLTGTSLDCTSQALAEVLAPLRIRRHLSLMPLSVLLENVAGVHAALRTGATCLVPPTRVTGMSFGSLAPQDLLAAITRHEPDSLILVPELLRLLVGAAQGTWQPPRSLKFIAVGGARVSGVLLDAADGAGLPVYQGYGLSECASVVCLNTPAAHRRGSVGKPLPHVRVQVDAAGEIHVQGPVMAGYVDGPASSLPDRWFATGDLGEIDADGYLYLKGRRRNVIITSLGRNVSPEWVESELLADPAVAWAVAAGEGEPWIGAWLYPSRPGMGATALDAAVASANLRLPPYAQVRQWWLLPEAPSLQNGMLTANGRLRREVVLGRLEARRAVNA
jgi:long-subunit acyl-CoA synthetase (AMP-forming)